MEFKDYYQILGVCADADKKTIKTAYRQLARKYHPDVSDHSDAEEKFKEVSEAYQVLKDPEKRAEYDSLKQYGSGDQGFTPPPDWEPAGAHGGGENSQFNGEFSDFFSTMFGDDQADSPFNKAQHSNRPGRDIETDMPIFLEDTLVATSKPLSYHLNGENKTLNIKIPVGVTEGERIRLKGQGEAGYSNSPSGDLYLRIRLVPHPIFDVEYHNLIITVPLTPWEAALGGKIKLPTLQGEIQLTIPPNSQSGKRLRVRGRGLKTKTGQGDLYAILNVVMPTESTEPAVELWKKLADVAPFDPRTEWSKSR
jgi:curved DNA-binding protein